MKFDSIYRLTQATKDLYDNWKKEKLPRGLLSELLQASLAARQVAEEQKDVR